MEYGSDRLDKSGTRRELKSHRTTVLAMGLLAGKQLPSRVG